MSFLLWSTVTGTGGKGAKPSQDSPPLITDLEPTQTGIYLLVPESRALLLFHFLEGLVKDNGRETGGSRECGPA